MPQSHSRTRDDSTCVISMKWKEATSFIVIRISNPRSTVKTLIRAALLLVFAYLPCAKAQEIETPKVELYGGYDFVRYNANPRINGVSSSESFNANGITGEAVYNPASRLGIVGELSGYSLSRAGRDTTYQVSYLLGPRVSLRRGIVAPFAQALFGGVWAADGVTLGPVSAFGMTAGGGIDLRLSDSFAVRPLQAEYFLTKFPDGANNRQNNFRFAAGIILRIGRK